MILAQRFLELNGDPFAAYMALQRALLARYVSRGGTVEQWCERLAPAFQRRYASMLTVAAGR
ncbi:MAG: hypothetical protein IRZ00_20950 [Gemmatimonadetes bacterium]|nr:hypothetical protein [Gemmatimonadota bacterium]